MTAVTWLVLAGPASAHERTGEEVLRTDATWAAMMIPHHRMGIELTELALQKAENPEVKELAQQANEDQKSELPRLEAVAAAGGRSPGPPDEQIQRFNEQQMQELHALAGEDFDRYWLDVLSGHHMAAIMLTDTVLAGPAGGASEELQRQIHDGQLDQVSRMNELREQLG